MSADAERYRKAAITRVTTALGHTSTATRRAAFANANVPEAARELIDKVAKNAWKVTDEDVAAASAAGLSDDQLFELCVVAAMGQATRQLDAAMAALDEAENA